jgi:hypothetical protein
MTGSKTTPAHSFYVYMTNEGPLTTPTNGRVNLYPEKPSKSNLKAMESSAGKRLKLFRAMLVPFDQQFPDEEEKP